MALLSWPPCHHQKLGIWPRNVWRCGSAFPFLEGRSIKTPITSRAWDVSNCPCGPTVQPGEAMVISSVLWSNLQMTETEVLDPFVALVLEIIIDTIFTVSGWWTWEPEYFQMHMHYVYNMLEHISIWYTSEYIYICIYAYDVCIVKTACACVYSHRQADRQKRLVLSLTKGWCFCAWDRRGINTSQNHKRTNGGFHKWGSPNRMFSNGQSY